MNQELVKRIAYDLYHIRKKRGWEDDPIADFNMAVNIVRHFEDPNTTGWLYRYRDEDYSKYREFYIKHLNEVNHGIDG